MRHDMSKVIVERPRRRGKTGAHHPYRRAKQFNLIVDEDGQLEVADQFTTGQSGRNPIKPGKILGWDCKELNENLSPLFRYLDRQVGRRWDDVYSDICEHINTNSTVQQHILLHLGWHVELHTELREDGKVYRKTDRYYRAGTSLEDPSGGYAQLYVHPKTGILCASPVSSGKWKRGRPQQEVRFITDSVGFVKVDGLWFRVAFERANEDARLHIRERSSYFRDILGVDLPLDRLSYFKNNARAAYGREVYAVSKQSANSREIKRYKLNEPA
jgi:hypothetical protein